jgi:hypothetical protein
MSDESQNQLKSLIKRLREVIEKSDGSNLNPLCKIYDDMVKLYLKPYCKSARFHGCVTDDNAKYYCALGNQTLPRFCEVCNGPCSYREERE